MSIVRRGEKHLAAGDPENPFGTFGAALGSASKTAYQAVRFQLDAGVQPSGRRNWTQWQDGRRWRATAAGRRAGSGRRGQVSKTNVPASLFSLLLVVAVAAGSFLGASAFFVKYGSQLPDARTIALATLPQDSIIVDSANTVQLADIHREGFRHYEQKLDAMGRYLPEATIAIEDAKFYSEPGIDVTSIVRAAWVDYHEHKAVQGASTITQQLVKLRLIGNKSSLDRKAKEAVLALQVEQAFNKNQILEMYLNTAFYGNNAYGIEAAALTYFKVQPSKLDLAQASMLAGIPQNPSYNNPLINWKGARNRQHDVLAAMVRNHVITQSEADTAFAEDISEPNHMFRDANVILAPGFVSYVVDQLKALYGADAPYSAGFVVHTTLNWEIQQKAQQLIADNVTTQTAKGLHVSTGALVAIDPRTGEVRAMVGSADPHANGGQYNLAVWPPRNPGSSFKIFNYTAAIASGKYTSVTPIPDLPVTIKDPNTTEKPYQPQNYDHRTHGILPLEQAMANSLNIPAVRVELGIGVQTVAQMARNMGAPPYVPHPDPKNPGLQTYSKDDPLNAFGLSLTLGGFPETPLQMATGASVLATQGILRNITGIAAVDALNGGSLFKNDPNAGAKQVLDPRVAYIMEQIMSDDDNRALIFGKGTVLTMPNRRIAAKTGTTDNFTDGWTVAYTPSLAMATWIGNADSSSMGNYNQPADGFFVAAPVMHDFMAYSLDNVLKVPNGEWFAEPAGLDHFNYNGKLHWFLPGTSPSTPGPVVAPNAYGYQISGYGYGNTYVPPVTTSPSPSPGGGGGGGDQGGNPPPKKP